MANEDKPLDAVLHRGLRALAATKGPCPSIERLLEYQASELSPDEERELKTHLMACGSCEALFLRLENIGQAGELPERPARRLDFLRKPLFPYLVAALLFGVLVIEIGRKTTAGDVARSAIVAEALPGFELPQTRGRVDMVVRPGRSDGFVLKFFVPVSKDRRYFAGIRTVTGREVFKPIEISNVDPLGNLELICRTKAFPAGSYVLTISEDGSPRQFQYFFQVQ